MTLAHCPTCSDAMQREEHTMTETAKHTDTSLRRNDSANGIDVEFEGEWVALGNLSATSWSDPDQAKNKPYRAMASKLTDLFVRAPQLLAQRDALLEALERCVTEYMTATDTGPCMDCGGRDGHASALCPWAVAEAATAAVRSEEAQHGAEEARS